MLLSNKNLEMLEEIGHVLQEWKTQLDRMNWTIQSERFISTPVQIHTITYTMQQHGGKQVEEEQEPS